MKLINVSNHASSNWSNMQKAGWEAIIDIPLPQVNPYATISDVYRIANDLIKQIDDIAKQERYNVAVCVLGEYTLAYLLFRELEMRHIPVAVPTTERKAIEQAQPDGSTTKTSVFEFVQWRII